METCETCGVALQDAPGCARCRDVYDRLGGKMGGFAPFRAWLENVITARIRAFVAAGRLDEAVDARIKEAFDEHQGRYYHNRRPDY